jgi:phage terminase large subunit-like protein
MSTSTVLSLLQNQLPLLRAIKAQRALTKIEGYYPDTGPLRRDLYAKHLQFFAAGKEYRERLFLAANRVGKSEGVGAYETALHLTGRYPDWWEGKRFNHAVKWLVSGDTNTTVRDIIQQKLFGPPGRLGTGMIPAECICGQPAAKSGLKDAFESAHIMHSSGAISNLVLRSYEQGRKAFQGTELDGAWEDEEPPLEIHTENVVRTMTTGGMVMDTFTPLSGLTEVVLAFLPGGRQPEGKMQRYVTTATWDDAPHLSAQAKDELWNSIPPHQRDARSKGIPQLGSGAIYPIEETKIAEADFEIPKHWRRVWALDHGWDNFACVWGAVDGDSQTLHIYSGIKIASAEPAMQAHMVKSRGEWIPGVGDAAALNVADGEKIIDSYRKLGLNIQLPDKSVEAGIWDVWELMTAGRLRVFKSLSGWFDEFRLYRRDEKGRVVKSMDHFMDCTRYLVRSGMRRAITKPQPNIQTPHKTRKSAWL